MKCLLTFIGNNDCNIKEDSLGPVLSILGKMTFDRVYLFYSNDRYLPPASKILMFCREKYPNTEINYVAAKANNPTDYNIVYPAMYSAVKNIINKMKDENVEFTISLTSGTPTMHSCWIFLNQGGVIDANLIQVSRESKIDNIDFNLDDFPEIRDIADVKSALTKLSRENEIYKENLQLELDNIIGNCNAIMEIKKRISFLTNFDIPVFISGETGTGKELIAEAIHYKSKRKEKSFIKINCGAISPALFESEFFGHKKGAFTGANEDKDGKFKIADKGTIFLDEIADLPLQMQVKLFRVLGEGTIQPVGGVEEKVDVRIITATNKNLKKLVKDGKFREELMYRIVKQRIDVPPLRDRGNDIIIIANYFIKKFNKKHNHNKELTPEAIKHIKEYSWPGNIRLLKTKLENVYIYPGNKIDKLTLELEPEEKIQSGVQIPQDGLDFDVEIPKAYYKEALAKKNGNAAAAAKLLNIQPHTFRSRLRKLNIHFNKESKKMTVNSNNIYVLQGWLKS